MVYQNFCSLDWFTVRIPMMEMATKTETQIEVEESEIKTQSPDTKRTSKESELPFLVSK